MTDQTRSAGASIEAVKAVISIGGRSSISAGEWCRRLAPWRHWSTANVATIGAVTATSAVPWGWYQPAAIVATEAATQARPTPTTRTQPAWPVPRIRSTVAGAMDMTSPAAMEVAALTRRVLRSRWADRWAGACKVEMDGRSVVEVLMGRRCTPRVRRVDDRHRSAAA
jgi:hypothetical protein